MSGKLDCEIVRDLLPSYADGQTSEVTNRALREHLEGCPDCAEALRLMKEPEKTLPPQEKEIDYLKKVKKSGRLAAVLAAAAALLTALFAAALVYFVHGTPEDLNAHAFTVRVEGSTVSLGGSLASSGQGIARVSFTEKDGVVDIKLYTALIMPFNRASFTEAYTAREPVKAVTSGGIVLWENGRAISKTAGRVYAAAHPYVGDMPANQRTANALEIVGRYGAYKNELRTASEPYEWVLILEENIDPAEEAKARERMLSDSCLMIASVGNLGTVTWRYNCGSGQREYTVTAREASETAGGDIKSFASSASGMQRLVEKVR
ncbi:MAG: DUF4825 domain-containing protein [Oscillospiraceae bacterium]|nr:DUF4825 domain-containing protein [Oscillospiraceae bacterium]